MINKNSFKIGEKVTLKVYKVDEYSGALSIRIVCGKVIQLTDYLIVIQKKYNIESFRYSELNPVNDIQPIKSPYNEQGHNYEEDIINDAVYNVRTSGLAYAFSAEQFSKISAKLKQLRSQIYKYYGR